MNFEKLRRLLTGERPKPPSRREILRQELRKARANHQPTRRILAELVAETNRELERAEAAEARSAQQAG